MIQQDFTEYLKSIGASETLTEKDAKELNEAEAKILGLLRDYDWHSEDEMISLTKQRQAGRRMRQLRNYGFNIEAKNFGGRTWKYRLVR